MSLGALVNRMSNIFLLVVPTLFSSGGRANVLPSGFSSFPKNVLRLRFKLRRAAFGKAAPLF